MQVHSNISASNRSKMDVCALSLSYLAQDPNLPQSKLPFAWKLYEMLEMIERNQVDDIVSWVDDGQAFKVHNLKRFVAEIVPKYFKQSKYKSFQRQLYFYGFTRVSSSSSDCKGWTIGSYRHPMFRRGYKTLCLSMVPIKKNSNSNISGSTRKKRIISSSVTATNENKSAGVVGKNRNETSDITRLTSSNEASNIDPIRIITDTTATTLRDHIIIPRRVSVEEEQSKTFADATIADGGEGIDDDITPIPLLFQRSREEDEVSSLSSGDMHHGSSASSYISRQEELRKLQLQQFYRYINHKEEPPRHLEQNYRHHDQHQSQQQSLKQVRFHHSYLQQQRPRRKEKGKSCCIFGGKTFHFV